jgi:hypothetical protein
MPTATVRHGGHLVIALATVALAAACAEPAQSPTSPTAVSPAVSVPVIPSPDYVDPFPRQANGEAFEVCKDYVGAVGPAVTITVDVDINNDGSLDMTYGITLSDGECQNVWLAELPGDLVTVTESGPPGFTPSYVRSTYDTGTITTDPSVQGNSASGIVAGGNHGVLVIFTNTAEPPPSADGRFTGGGFQFDDQGVKVTRGFTIHCDNVLTNDLEVNWDGGNQFHMDKELLTLIGCTKPGDPVPPDAPVNMIEATSTGALNGVPGATIHFVLIDNGEPGKNNDQAFIEINGGAALSVGGSAGSPDTIDGGNIQAHWDQPHK